LQPENNTQEPHLYKSRHRLHPPNPSHQKSRAHTPHPTTPTHTYTYTYLHNGHTNNSLPPSLPSISDSRHTRRKAHPTGPPRLQPVTANPPQSHMASTTPQLRRSISSNSSSSTGECIAFPDPAAHPFQFPRRSTTSTTSSSASTTHTHSRQRSRGSSSLFSAPSLDSEADTVSSSGDDDDDLVAHKAAHTGTGVVPGFAADLDPPHRSVGLDARRLARMWKGCARSGKLVRSVRRVCSYRFRDDLPPPVVYSEPQYSLVGDIKAVRFDDCVGTPAAPCTDWDDVECQAALVVGRDPTLPELECSRSGIVGGFRESRYALNRLSQSFR
jgi:hypothetical protein